MQRTIKGDVALEYLRRFPKSSKLSIARMLYKDHPLLFTSVDNARTVVRKHTNSQGKSSRSCNQSERIIHQSGHTRENPYGLPASYEEIRLPYILPRVNNNILIISDLHIPYHNIAAINCAIKYGLEQKVNTIFINGDLLDFYAFSRFEKDPRKRSAKDEIEAGKEFLAKLRKLFPHAGIYYHLGNHCIRYQKWLMAHPEIFDDPYFELETRLELIKQKIHLIGDKQITHCGKEGHLSLHHGHYIFRGAQSPVSPAKTIYDKMAMSMICGHTHKVSEYTMTNGKNKLFTCWSTGSLCELLPDYSPMANKYAHGFAHAIIKNDGTFSVRNFRINEGKIL